MGGISGNIDVDELISFSNDLVEFLRDKKDISNLNQILEHSRALQSSCAADFDDVHSLLQGYFPSLIYAHPPFYFIFLEFLIVPLY